MIDVADESHMAGVVALEECFPVGGRWSAELWRAELGAPGRHLLVALDDDGHVRGAMVLRAVGEVADLDRVVVDLSLRRRGIARALVCDGLERLRAEGVDRVLLEVSASNASALALYDSVGFTTIAWRDNYYGAGDHAHVMALELTETETKEATHG